MAAVALPSLFSHAVTLVRQRTGRGALVIFGLSERNYLAWPCGCTDGMPCLVYLGGMGAVRSVRRALRTLLLCPSFLSFLFFFCRSDSVVP